MSFPGYGRNVLQELTEKMKHTEKSGSVSNIDEMHFQEFISTHPFAVIDFWAEWCGPCRRIAPIMDELAREFTGKVAFGKCNTDDNRRYRHAVQYLGNSGDHALLQRPARSTGSSAHTPRTLSGKRLSGSSGCNKQPPVFFHDYSHGVPDAAARPKNVEQAAEFKWR